jgi:hypothetical protein
MDLLPLYSVLMASEGSEKIENALFGSHDIDII